MEATRFDNTRKKLVTLKKNKEFTFLYHRGKSCSTKLIVLIYFKNRYGGMRSGFSVSKKVGKAVVRNKVRRRLKESMRALLQENTSHVHANMIFVARTPIVQASYSQIKKDMKYLMKKAGLFEAETADQGETK